jgi:hypothetical protein
MTRRLPSFTTAFAGSVAALVMFALWAFVDRAFVPLVTFPWRDSWDDFAIRQSVFVVLALAAVLSTAMVVVRLFVGDRRGRSLKALFLSVVLASGWLALFVSYDSIAWAGFVWNVRRILPGLEADAKVVCGNWPTTNGELPYLGKYEAVGPDCDWPRTLLLENWSGGYKFSFAGGPSIERGGEGRIRFDLGNHFIGWIEYRADRNELAPSDPAIHIHQSGGGPYYIELEPKWFLVWRDHNLFGPGSQVSF